MFEAVSSHQGAHPQSKGDLGAIDADPRGAMNGLPLRVAEQVQGELDLCCNVFVFQTLVPKHKASILDSLAGW